MFNFVRKIVLFELFYNVKLMINICFYIAGERESSVKTLCFPFSVLFSRYFIQWQNSMPRFIFFIVLKYILDKIIKKYFVYKSGRTYLYKKSFPVNQWKWMLCRWFLLLGYFAVFQTEPTTIARQVELVDVIVSASRRQLGFLFKYSNCPKWLANPQPSRSLTTVNSIYHNEFNAYFFSFVIGFYLL